MPKKRIQEETAAFERAAKAVSRRQKYVLRLYVAGMNPRSRAAIRTITKVCEENLKDRCELEIIDIYHQPTLARGEQIVAVPTLLKKVPVPLRRIIGDMASMDRVLIGLDLQTSKRQ